MIRYIYSFAADIAIEQVEDTLALSLLALESLNGASRLRLGLQYELDRDKRACSIDADTEIGEQLNLLFVGYLRRQFDDAFTVRRTNSGAGQVKETVAA